MSILQPPSSMLPTKKSASTPSPRVEDQVSRIEACSKNHNKFDEKLKIDTKANNEKKNETKMKREAEKKAKAGAEKKAEDKKRNDEELKRLEDERRRVESESNNTNDLVRLMLAACKV